MVISFTDDIDLVGRGKRVYTVGLNAAGATVVRIRRGSLAGAVAWEFGFSAAGQQHFSFKKPLYISEGVFIECTVALTSGFIDIG